MITIPIADYDFNPPVEALRVDVDGAAELVRIYFEGDELPGAIPDLAIAKQRKIEEIYAIAKSKDEELVLRYGRLEMAGWLDKEKEAKAYQATQDPASCPQLALEAEDSEVTLESLVATVLENAASLRTANRAILAQRSRLKADVEACVTVEDVQAIEWF